MSTGSARDLGPLETIGLGAAALRRRARSRVRSPSTDGDAKNSLRAHVNVLHNSREGRTREPRRRLLPAPRRRISPTSRPDDLDSLRRRAGSPPRLVSAGVMPRPKTAGRTGPAPRHRAREQQHQRRRRPRAQPRSPMRRMADPGSRYSFQRTPRMRLRSRTSS